MLSLKLHTSDIVNEDVDEEDQNMLLTFEESRAEGWPIYTFIYYFIDLFIYLFIHSFVWIRCSSSSLSGIFKKLNLDLVVTVKAIGKVTSSLIKRRERIQDSRKEIFSFPSFPLSSTDEPSILAEREGEWRGREAKRNIMAQRTRIMKRPMFI